MLMDGHTGRSAAGAVIESFGHFLIGRKFAVGIIVFAILVVINIIVVTKGAERIAEVGARFTRDAMPGKQMVIAAQPKLQTVEPNAQASWGDLVREAAQMAGFTVLDRSTVVATHLSHCVAHGALLADEEPAAATPALNRYPTEER